MRPPIGTAASLLVIALSVAGCQASVAPPAASGMGAATRPTAGRVGPDPRIGALFPGGDDTHTCTASVLHSTRGDLILTAAHCVSAGQDTTFVPNLSGPVAPDQMWPVTAVYVDPRWLDDRDPHADYAILRASRPGSPPIEQQVGGAFSLGVSLPAGSPVMVVGYPFGDGGTPLACRGITDREGDYPALNCAGLVDGTSGAPWLSGSTVTGVTGGLQEGGCGADVSYSAPFGPRATELLARAEAGGPGDAVDAAGPPVADEC